MPANPGTQAHIVCSLSSKRSFRKDVWPLNLTSQIQLLKNIQNVDLTTTYIGEYQLSGMREPTSVYNDEGYLDPYSNTSTLFTFPSISTTISNYRRDSAVPNSLQCYITVVDEALAIKSGPVTRSMVRETPLPDPTALKTAPLPLFLLPLLHSPS